MAVEWVDPDSVTAAAGNEARSADFNSALQDLKYLHDPPRCAVRRNTNQAVTTATATAISWSAAVWDSHGDMWDSGAPTRVTITRDGVYTIICSVLWEDNATGVRSLILKVNGSTNRRGNQQDASSPLEQQLSLETNLADGDYIEVIATHNAGSDQDLVATRTVMTVRWAAAAPASGE